METFNDYRGGGAKKDFLGSINFLSFRRIYCLKRTASILFLLIVLFNFYGYRMVIDCLQSNSDVSMQKQVDKNNYSNSELISIKTTLNLPYYSSSANYERAYGSVTINGVSYEYVKRRVYKDTMELLCLPNAAKTNLQAAKNEITKSLADAQASTSGKKNHSTVKISLPDFFQPVKIFSASCDVVLNKNISDYHSSLQNGFTLKLKKPPKALLLLS